MAQRLTRLALRRPVAVLACLALLTALAAFGALRLRSGNFLEGHLPGGDRAFKAFQHLVEEFGGDQVVILGLGCEADRCETVFEPRVLTLIRDLSRAALGFEGVAEVRSLAQASVLVADGSTLRAERVPEEIDEESARRFRALVENDPTLLGTVVSKDLSTTALLVRFDPALLDDLRNRSALELRHAVRNLAAEEGFELYATGHVIRTAEADSYVRRDLLRLTPAMVLLLAGLLSWIFRDAVSVGLALLAVALPAIWSFGLMSWTDRPLTPVVSVLPILILVVGITDSVHLLVRFHDLRSSREAPGEIIRQVVREIGPPTTVTAVTSALGFLSFLTARLPNLRDFGLLAAVGVLGAWLTTFTLLPAALLWLGNRIRVRRLPAFALGDRILDAVRHLAWRRAAVIVACAGGGVLACWVGIERIVPENDPLRLLGERDPAVQAERFFRKHLKPLDTIELLYEPPDGSLVTDPPVLARLEAAEEALSHRLGSTTVASVLSILRVAHREIVDGSLRVPRGQGEAAQLLLLAESADPDGVYGLVTPDRRMARLSVGYGWAGSHAIAQDLAGLRDKLATILDRDGYWALTGTVALGSRIGELILEGQIASFSTAFLTIFAVLLVFLRSFRLGALGMLPNVYPVAVILAFMGFAGIYLDVGTAMIASILLGVSVDDTVYFLMHYQRARRRGADVSDAVAYTFAIAGKPALFCAGSLAIGFFVLGFSSFQSLSIFGLLSGVAVLLAAATELILMPAVLRVSAGRTR